MVIVIIQLCGEPAEYPIHTLAPYVMMSTKEDVNGFKLNSVRKEFFNFPHVDYCSKIAQLYSCLLVIIIDGIILKWVSNYPRGGGGWGMDRRGYLKLTLPPIMLCTLLLDIHCLTVIVISIRPFCAGFEIACFLWLYFFVDT